MASVIFKLKTMQWEETAHHHKQISCCENLRKKICFSCAMVKVRLDPTITKLRILTGKKYPKKSPALTKSMNVDIRVVAASNQPS